MTVAEHDVVVEAIAQPKQSLIGLDGIGGAKQVLIVEGENAMDATSPDYS